MQEEGKPDALLAPYRAIDLTDEKGFMCGKILADLGADVIKVERPGGDPARRIGPFYHDEPHPEKSLYWLAYNMNKRGITLDIETSDGQELFKRLVKTTDFVIESFDPGYMSSLGLGYPDLEKINPRIIMVSITPFGQTGPYVEQGYKVDDMIVWALGGFMFLCGDSDRPPTQISFPQAYLHGAAEAANAAMMALYAREMYGEGQHVDVSIQQSIHTVTQVMMNMWDIYKVISMRGPARGYPRPNGTTIRSRYFYPCKDGWILLLVGGGALQSMVLSSQQLVQLMDKEGMASDLKDYDWASHDTSTVRTEQVGHMQLDIITPFLMKHTKMEFYKEAVKRKILGCPVQDCKDVSECPQLAAREFFVTVEHPELGDALTYCGPFVKLSETPLTSWQRGPLIGEHNQEVYEKELGLTREQLLNLKQANII